MNKKYLFRDVEAALLSFHDVYDRSVVSWLPNKMISQSHLHFCFGHLYFMIHKYNIILCHPQVCNSLPSIDLQEILCRQPRGWFSPAMVGFDQTDFFYKLSQVRTRIYENINGFDSTATFNVPRKICLVSNKRSWSTQFISVEFVEAQLLEMSHKRGSEEKKLSVKGAQQKEKLYSRSCWKKYIKKTIDPLGNNAILHIKKNMNYIVGLGRLSRTRSSPPSWRIWSLRSWAPRCLSTFDLFLSTSLAGNSTTQYCPVQSLFYLEYLGCAV